MPPRARASRGTPPTSPTRFPALHNSGGNNGICCAADRSRTFGLARSAIGAGGRDRVAEIPSHYRSGIGAAHRGAARPAVALPAGVMHRSLRSRGMAAVSQQWSGTKPTAEDAVAVSSRDVWSAVAASDVAGSVRSTWRAFSCGSQGKCRGLKSQSVFQTANISRNSFVMQWPKATSPRRGNLPSGRL